MSVGFLIDMDGVIYRGHELIPGSLEFVRRLLDHQIPFMFLTNNSQRTPIDIAIRMQRLGFPITPDHVYTSALATAQYLSQQKPQGTAYVIGEGGLLNALHDVGFAIIDHAPDYVIVGEGRTFTLETLERAVQMVANGAKLIATNLDPNCPTPEGGLRPGCGAFVKMIEEATGLRAFSPGKPSPVIFRAARKKLGLRSGETFMIGDTMETDILGAVQLGYQSVLVLSGGTKKQDLNHFAYRPDLVVNSLADLGEEFFANLMLRQEKLINPD
ncbi:MAG: HAD-IIA family hydrolase [Oligoflexus sp.]